MPEFVTCCHIARGSGMKCRGTAVYHVAWGTAPDNYTYACSLHLGKLLSDAPEHMVTRLERPAQ